MDCDSKALEQAAGRGRLGRRIGKDLASSLRDHQPYSVVLAALLMTAGDLGD